MTITNIQKKYILADLKANRPASGTFDGQIFVATDTNENFVWDEGGGTWNSIGVTDHGSLTGLADDDHSQYLNSTRFESNYMDWKLLDSHTDTNTGTNFSYDSGALATSYDMYMVVAVINDESAGGTSPQCQININGDTSGNYGETKLDVTTNTGQSYWRFYLADGTTGVIVYYFRGAVGSKYPTCVGHFGAGQGNSYEWKSGVLTVNYSDVNQIAFAFQNATTGKLKLYGLNL